MKYILDANNICRYGSSCDEIKVNVSYLSSMIAALESAGHSWFCFTDANLGKLIDEYASEEDIKLYAAMLEKYPDKIVSVPSAQQADNFILQKASDEGCHIISNDLYRQYEKTFPWLRIKDDNGAYLDNSQRRVHAFVVADQVIQVPDLAIFRSLKWSESLDRNRFLISSEREREIESENRKIKEEARNLFETLPADENEFRRVFDARMAKATDRFMEVRPGDPDFAEVWHEYELMTEVQTLQMERMEKILKRGLQEDEKMCKELEELAAQTTPEDFRRAQIAKSIEERAARGEFDGFWGGVKGLVAGIMGGVMMSGESEKDKK